MKVEPSSVQQNVDIVTWGLKARIVEQEEMAIARQRLGKHTPEATDTHTTME
jgi:hypothetical protein